MRIGDVEFQDFQVYHPEAVRMEEGGMAYVHIPKLNLPNGSIVEALLQYTGNESYPTRLLLPNIVVSPKAQNWTQHVVFGKSWSTWSWKDVYPNIPIIEVLLNHMGALQ